jgi:hypothetical protein
MSDNLDRYLPEFDEEETRAKLVGLTREQLVEMLIYDLPGVPTADGLRRMTEDEGGNTAAE